MMTLKQFQATGRDVPDTRAVLGPEWVIAGEPAVPGRCYDGDCIIDGPNADGEYTLTLHNEGWQTRDLAKLEAILYLWCMTERRDSMGVSDEFATALDAVMETAGGLEVMADFIRAEGPETSLDDLADVNDWAFRAYQQHHPEVTDENALDSGAGDLIEELHAWAQEQRDEFAQVDDDTRSNGPRR